MDCLLYSRFSPRPGASTCPSCDRQLADLGAWAQLGGLRVIHQDRDEDISGDDWSRAGLDRCAEVIRSLPRRREKPILAVTAWDRLARDEIGALLFVRDRIEGRARLYSLQEGWWGEDRASIGTMVHLWLAAEKKAQISQKTAAAMRRYQADGRIMGSIPPYGFRASGKRREVVLSGGDKKMARLMEPCEKEQAVIADMRQMQAEGKGPFAIASKLNALGVKCRGREWRYKTVERILAR